MNMFLKSPQGVSERLKEGEDYVVVKGEAGFEYKYVNLANEKYVKRQGIVEVEPLRYHKGIGGVPKHENYAVIKRYRDRRTKLLWGIPSEWDDSKKEMKHENIVLEGKMMFDLSIEDDAIKFAIIANSPYIEGSPNADGRPTFKVVDKQVKAESNIDRRSLRRKAEDIIASLKETELIEMARNFGINVAANASLAMLTDQMFAKMEENPRGFLDIWNNPERPYISIFHLALSKGIITENRATSTFMFGGQTLGHSKEMAIKYLVDNNSTATSIKMMCEQQDAETAKSMSFVKRDDSQDEIARLRAELEELKKSKGVFAFDTTAEGHKQEVTDKNEVDEEMIALKAEAKDLKITGWAVLKKDKLKEKIEEAKSKQE